ncbi:MAG: hypothetical protein NWF05_08850 [Candidatus Bathyarchaeota archaeon]|nr:hypothetical protein [Candidatus Bathyarchaeota archaeon]
MELAHAQEKAKQIFGLKVPFFLDGRVEAFSNINSVMRGIELADHDWHYDINRIFYKRIVNLSKRYEVDFPSAIRFCICHETGHAKEERLFEEAGFFPYQKGFMGGVPIEVDSTKYVLGDANFYDSFSCGICDFSVNAELAKNGVVNPVSRRIFFDAPEQKAPTPETKQQWHKVLFDSLCALPHVLNVYEHGELTKDEKAGLKESQERIIGVKSLKRHFVSCEISSSLMQRPRLMRLSVY